MRARGLLSRALCRGRPGGRRGAAVTGFRREVRGGPARGIARACRGSSPAPAVLDAPLALQLRTESRMNERELPLYVGPQVGRRQ